MHMNVHDARPSTDAAAEGPALAVAMGGGGLSPSQTDQQLLVGPIGGSGSGTGGMTVHMGHLEVQQRLPAEAVGAVAATLPHPHQQLQQVPGWPPVQRAQQAQQAPASQHLRVDGRVGQDSVPQQPHQPMQLQQQQPQPQQQLNHHHHHHQLLQQQWQLRTVPQQPQQVPPLSVAATPQQQLLLQQQQQQQQRQPGITAAGVAGALPGQTLLGRLPTPPVMGAIRGVSPPQAMAMQPAAWWQHQQLAQQFPQLPQLMPQMGHQSMPPQALAPQPLVSPQQAASPRLAPAAGAAGPLPRLPQLLQQAHPRQQAQPQQRPPLPQQQPGSQQQPGLQQQQGQHQPGMPQQASVPGMQAGMQTGMLPEQQAALQHQMALQRQMLPFQQQQLQMGLMQSQAWLGGGAVGQPGGEGRGTPGGSFRAPLLPPSQQQQMLAQLQLQQLHMQMGGLPQYPFTQLYGQPGIAGMAGVPLAWPFASLPPVGLAPAVQQLPAFPPQLPAFDPTAAWYASHYGGGPPHQGGAPAAAPATAEPRRPSVVAPKSAEADQQSGKSAAAEVRGAGGGAVTAGGGLASIPGRPDAGRYWWKDAALTFGTPGDPEALERLAVQQEQRGRARREAQMENAAVALTSDPADISDEVTSRLRGQDSTTQGDIPSHNDYIGGRPPSDGGPLSGPLSATAPSPTAAAATDGAGSAIVNEPSTPAASPEAGRLSEGAPPADPSIAAHVDVPTGAAPHDLPPSAFVQTLTPEASQQGASNQRGKTWPPGVRAAVQDAAAPQQPGTNGELGRGSLDSSRGTVGATALSRRRSAAAPKRRSEDLAPPPLQLGQQPATTSVRRAPPRSIRRRGSAPHLQVVPPVPSGDPASTTAPRNANGAGSSGLQGGSTGVPPHSPPLSPGGAPGVMPGDATDEEGEGASPPQQRRRHWQRQ